MAAFSLIELVVSMAVITFLAVLAFSTIQALTKNSLKARCVSNLSSLGQTAILYAAEHQNALLPFRMEPMGLWFDHLHQYIQREPGRAGRNVGGVPTPYVGWHCPTAGRQYHINRICGWNDGQQAVPAAYLKRGQGFHKRNYGTIFDVPGGLSKTAWFADPSPDGEAFQLESYKNNGRDFIGFPHSNSCNVLFMDGHVENKLNPNFASHPERLYEQEWLLFFGYQSHWFSIP